MKTNGVHSPPSPGTTLYLTVLPYKAASPCCLSLSVHWLPSLLRHRTSVTARQTYSCPICLLDWSRWTLGCVVERRMSRFRGENLRFLDGEFTWRAFSTLWFFFHSLSQPGEKHPQVPDSDFHVKASPLYPGRRLVKNQWRGEKNEKG